MHGTTSYHIHMICMLPGNKKQALVGGVDRTPAEHHYTRKLHILLYSEQLVGTRRRACAEAHTRTSVPTADRSCSLLEELAGSQLFRCYLRKNTDSMQKLKKMNKKNIFDRPLRTTTCCIH